MLTDFSKRSSETIAQYQAPSQGPNTLSFPEDFRNGEHGFALAVREHLVWLQKTLWPDRHPRTNHQAKVIQQIIEDLQRRITKIESPYLIIAGLSLLSDLTYVNHLRYINKKIKNIDQFWEQWIDRLLVIAPRRTDSAITYFSWLLSNKKHEALAKYAYRVLIKNPNDPIGWFFYGAAFIKDGSAEKRREALRNIKKGIDLGIERYMPIPRTNHQAKVIQQIIEDLQRRITKIESPYLIIAGLSLLSDLTYVNHLRYINKKIKNIDQFWEQWIDRLLVIAPRRTDSAITYFSWLLSNKKHEALAKYAYRVLIKNPNDPIGWFFYGAAFIKDGSAEKRREALRNIKKGIDLGIERYMPINPNVKKMIKAAE